MVNLVSHSVFRSRFEPRPVSLLIQYHLLRSQRSFRMNRENTAEGRTFLDDSVYGLDSLFSRIPGVTLQVFLKIPLGLRIFPILHRRHGRRNTTGDILEVLHRFMPLRCKPVLRTVGVNRIWSRLTGLGINTSAHSTRFPYCF